MPKRIGYLWSKIATKENVLRAWEIYNSHRPIRKRVPICEGLSEQIANRLKAHTFDYGIPRKVSINERGKKRLLHIPSFQSTLAQTAIYIVIEPVMSKKMNIRSFSSRPKMGMHLCAKKQEKLIQTDIKNYKYCLYFDIRKYYEHIDHSILMKMLGRIFKDKELLEEIEKIIQMCPNGISLGSPLSHLLANIYLNQMYYKIIKVKGVNDAFVYMDNWTIYAPTKAALKRAKVEAENELLKLSCSMKDDYQKFPTAKREVKTCGIRIKHGKGTLAYKDTWKRGMKSLAKIRKGNIDEHTVASAGSYKGIFMRCDNTHLWLKPNEWKNVLHQLRQTKKKN